jgi:hypothetical protein
MTSRRTFWYAQVLCLDASLSLQQAWISNLVSRFELREADLPRQLQAEWRAALEVVPEEVGTTHIVSDACEAGWRVVFEEVPRKSGCCICSRHCAQHLHG